MGIFSKPVESQPLHITLLDGCTTPLQTEIILKQLEILRKVVPPITPNI